MLFVVGGDLILEIDDKRTHPSGVFFADTQHPNTTGIHRKPHTSEEARHERHHLRQEHRATKSQRTRQQMAGAIELYTLTNTIDTIHLEPYRLENMYTIPKGKSNPTSTKII